MLGAFFGAAVLVTLESFEAGFVFADFESTVLGSVTGFSLLAALVAFLTAGFTVLGAVFLGFGLLVPDAFVAFTALGLAAGAFLAAALDFCSAAALAFGAFFGGLLAGGEVLFLVAVLGLVADLAFPLIVALTTVASAFLDFSATTFAVGALDALAGVLAFSVFLGFAAIVDSNLLGHKKPDRNRARTLPEVARFAKRQIKQTARDRWISRLQAEHTKNDRQDRYVVA